LHLNLPFTDVEGYISGRILQSGERMKSYIKPFSEYKNILIVEDSIWSGSSIINVKGKLNGLYPEKKVLYTAIYAVTEATNNIDFYF